MKQFDVSWRSDEALKDVRIYSRGGRDWVRTTGILCYVLDDTARVVNIHPINSRNNTSECCRLSLPITYIPQLCDSLMRAYETRKLRGPAYFPAVRYPAMVTEDWLDDHPGYIFVFGDNTERVGMGGAAALRCHPQSYGFVTKRTCAESYKPEEYFTVFMDEVQKFRTTAADNPDKIYLVSKVGAGLANEFQIWEKIIRPHMKQLLSTSPNVKFMW